MHPDYAGNRAGGMPAPFDDDLRAVLDGAAHSVTDLFVQNRYLAVPMETRGIVASWDAQRREFDVWVSTQSPHDVRTVTGRITGVPEGQIRVRMGDVGGGFGQKAYLARDEQIVILASYHLGKPLKWIEDRHENLVAATSSRAERATVTMAADADGTILGVRVDHLDEVGAYPQAGSAAGMGALIFTGPYRIPKLSFSTQSAFTNTCSRAPYRGPWQIETYLREQAVDRLARRHGHRPDRAPAPQRHPARPAAAPPAHGPAARPRVAGGDVGAGRGDDRLRRIPPRSTGAVPGGTAARDRHRRCTSSRRRRWAPYAAEPAHIRVQPSGSVDVYLGSGSHGQGIETTTAQLVSEHLGVAFDTVTVHQGDTSETPYAFGTGGSRSGPILGAAIQLAAQELRTKIAAIAAHQLEASEARPRHRRRRHRRAGHADARSTVAAVAHTAYLSVGALPPGMEPGLEILKRYKTDLPFIFSNACHMCTVEIDAATGAVRLLRFVVSEDCGVMINPAVVEGQIAGGAVQGIGGALLEDFVYDEDGNPLTTTFLDYLLPTAADVPSLEYGHIETPATTPGHHKGVGEGGAIGAPAAVANAVNDALALVGAFAPEAPFSPSRIVAALEAVGR